MSDNWPQIPSTTMADRVYNAMRDRILKGGVRPGEFLREHEVSRGMGVSRTPVREALGRLASEGFVERIPHRGFRVPHESIERLLELYPIVASLEVLAGRTSLSRLTPANMDELRCLNRQIRAVIESGNNESGVELNNRFHHVLSEPCGNRRLCELLDDLRSQMARLELWSVEHLSHVVQSVRQHDEIIAAIEKKAFAQALSVLEKNRLQTYTAFFEEIGPRAPMTGPADDKTAMLPLTGSD